MNEHDARASDSELIIVGGGLVGLSLAIACAEGGIDTLVIEAESPEALVNANYDGRSCAIAHGSQQVLAAIGAWEAMAPHAQPIVDIRVTDGGWHVKGESRAYVHYSNKDLPRRFSTMWPKGGASGCGSQVRIASSSAGSGRGSGDCILPIRGRSPGGRSLLL